MQIKKMAAMTGSILMLLLTAGCGRELEDREFPSVLVIQEVPLEEAVKKAQAQSSKYLDYGQAKSAVVLEAIAADEEKLKDILVYMEKNPVFARNMLFFVGDEEAVAAAEQQADRQGDELEDFYKNTPGGKEAESVTLGEMTDYLHNYGKEIISVPRLRLEEGELKVQGSLELQKKVIQAGNFPKWKLEE